MKFEIGDKVELINGSTMAARVGATGTVYGCLRYLSISIKWDRNELDNGQQDGEYINSDYKLVEPLSWKERYKR